MKNLYLIFNTLIGGLITNLNIELMADILILLNTFLMPISIISNWNNLSNQKIYRILLTLLNVIVLLNLITNNLLSFYIWFEATLIPLYIIITLYGSKYKVLAGNYIIVYTILSSFFMLLSIIIYYSILYNTNLFNINIHLFNTNLQLILLIGILIGLLVKVPVIPLHNWLPIVHSESPLAGSILLAGIILKLSLYGIIIIILPNHTDSMLILKPILYTLSILSILYISINIINQYDLKVIIAYSSITHMAVCLISIISNNIFGIFGSIQLSIAHGLVSPGLFIIFGGILYDRYKNRIIYYYQGLYSVFPLLSIYILIYSLCNIGVPLSLNFIGEFFSILGAINNNYIIGTIMTLTLFFTTLYQFRLINKILGGNTLNLCVIKTNDCTFREITILNILLIPTIILGIYPINLYSINTLLFL